MNLDLLKKAKVLVIGDIILDRYIHGNVDRVSPEAPVPILRPEFEERRLGGAANVASNISALGSKVWLQGVVGKDEAAKEIRSLIKERNIKGFFITSKFPTISKLRILASRQQLLRVDSEEKFSEEDWTNTRNLFSKLISTTKASVLILSDYEKGTLRDIPLLIKQANKKNLYTLVDPKGNNFSKYKGANIITPNYLEFSNAVGGVSDESDLTLKAKNLITDLKLDALLITRGAEGMTLIEKQEGKIKRSDFSTQAQEVFDVSGAGDTIIATLAASIIGNLPIRDSFELANLAAGIVVRQLRTMPITQYELLMKLHSLTSINTINKVISKNQVVDFFKAFKGEIVIGFTNGCFDILHAGHVTYLQKAKEQVDMLFVALNSDASVRKIKGANRPIIGEADRALVLCSLESVDGVILFDEATPLSLIKSIKPDVLFKGNDYTIKNVVGAKEMKKWGGKVTLIPIIKGRSTTKIIEKLS